MAHIGFLLLAVPSVGSFLGSGADSPALIGTVLALAALLVLSNSMQQSTEADFALTGAVAAVGSIAVLAVVFLGLLP